MEVGSQTDPMDPRDILNLLRQKSSEMEVRKIGAVSIEDQDEIHSAELIDGEVFFNSHNEPEFRKNSYSGGKSASTKSKSHPSSSTSGQPSFTDKICEAVWSRKESLHGTTGSSSTKSSKKLGRSQSFKGSSSTSSSLSPTKIQTAVGGGGSGVSSGTATDPYARRSSGCPSYGRPNNNPISGSSREYSPSASPKFYSSRARRSHGDIDIRRQISATLSPPSRQDSVKSISSKTSKSTSGQVSPVIIRPDTTSKPSASQLTNCNSNKVAGQQFYLGHVQGSSSKSLVPSARASRSSSVAQSGTGEATNQHQINDLPLKVRRQRKYVILGFSFLLLVAIACVVISLSISSHIDAQVRKENAILMQNIQQKTSNLNLTSSNNSQISSSSFSPSPPVNQIEDQDESSGNYDTTNNSNNNNNNNLQNNNNNLNPPPGQSLMTRRVNTVDPGQEEIKLNVAKKESSEVDRGGGDEDGVINNPLSSSLIGEILLNNTKIIKGKSFDEEDAKNTQTQFKSENSNILIGQISDIDELERVRTRIVLR